MDTGSESIYTDGTYFSKHPEMHVSDSPWKAEQIIEILARNDLHPKNICEIGCGAGEIINTMHDQMSKDINFYGYEILPEAYKFCRTKEKERLNYILGDLLKESDKFFDLILCIDVFEHVGDYLGFIKTIKEKGKYVIFHIPLDLSVQSVLREKPILLSRSKNGHLHYFTKNTAIETLRYCGYDILDYFYTLGSIERGSKTLLNRIAQWPRRVFIKINEDWAVRLLGGCSLIVLAEGDSKNEK